MGEPVPFDNQFQFHENQFPIGFHLWRNDPNFFGFMLIDIPHYRWLKANCYQLQTLIVLVKMAQYPIVIVHAWTNRPMDYIPLIWYHNNTSVINPRSLAMIRFAVLVGHAPILMALNSIIRATCKLWCIHSFIETKLKQTTDGGE